MSGYFFLLISCFVEISILNANSVDPDQMPHSAASDLGLHCLPMSLLWDARLKWVNLFTFPQAIKPQQTKNKDLFLPSNLVTLQTSILSIGPSYTGFFFFQNPGNYMGKVLIFTSWPSNYLPVVVPTLKLIPNHRLLYILALPYPRYDRVYDKYIFFFLYFSLKT